ncbi:MAG: MaoC family dehydratase [Sphingomonadaceae bacterium]
MIYFDDIEIGQKSAFGNYVVTREEVVDFATKYDPQPFHLSDEAAATTYFGKLSASGWHTAAMMMRMTVDNLSAIQQAGLGSPGIDELRWLKPVYPGDTLRLESEIIDKRPSRSRADMGSFRTRTSVINQDDVVVMTMIAIGLIRRRTGGEPATSG